MITVVSRTVVVTTSLELYYTDWSRSDDAHIDWQNINDDGKQKQLKILMQYVDNEVIRKEPDLMNMYPAWNRYERMANTEQDQNSIKLVKLEIGARNLVEQKKRLPEQKRYYNNALSLLNRAIERMKLEQTKIQYLYEIKIKESEAKNAKHEYSRKKRELKKLSKKSNEGERQARSAALKYHELKLIKLSEELDSLIVRLRNVDKLLFRMDDRPHLQNGWGNSNIYGTCLRYLRNMQLDELERLESLKRNERLMRLSMMYLEERLEQSWFKLWSSEALLKKLHFLRESQRVLRESQDRIEWEKSLPREAVKALRQPVKEPESSEQISLKEFIP
jgi:hypothetical protein